ncbi:MAG: pectate lyase [Polyangiales bacterium]
MGNAASGPSTAGGSASAGSGVSTGAAGGGTGAAASGGAGPDASGGAGAAAGGGAGPDASGGAGAAAGGGAGPDASGGAGAAAGSGAGPDASGGAGAAAGGGAASGAGARGATGTGGAGGSAAGMAADGCEGLDVPALLRELAPSDEELASDYAKYLADELGNVTCATEGSGTPRTITQPIFVPPGATYDGRGETLTADAALMRCDTSEGEQAESQRPYFLLAPGASLAHVTITYPGCEGAHMMGDNTLDDVTWQDAGEDAASVRSYFPGGAIAIINSEGHKAADKMFQFNVPCDVRIENFTGSDMGKLVRQNGGETFELKIDLNTVDVTGVVSAVVQSDSPQCFVRHHALTYAFTGSGDKADRVFRDIPPGNISEY